MSKKSTYLLKALTVFLAYFISAKFGLKLDPVSGFASLVWLPTGISLAAMLILGFEFWPAILVGAFLANLTAGASIFTAIGIALGNTLEAFVGAYLLKKLIDFRNTLERLKDVLGLIIFAAFVSTLISATIGVFALLLSHTINIKSFAPTWYAWWIGDMISDLVVAPLILVWTSKRYFRINFTPQRTLEVAGLVFSIVITILMIYGDFFGMSNRPSPRAYLIFPSLIWAALRFGSVGAVTTTFIVSAISLLITSLGYGPFIGGSLNQNLLSVQVYLGVMSISTLILAALGSERRELEQRKDEFISIASHELKTPITTIKGYTQILSKGLNIKHHKKELFYISKMDDQLSRLTKLVNDLLDVSKIQSGTLQLQKERVDIKELIKGVVTDLQLVSKHKIIFDSPNKELFAWVDKYLINEVLVNLISNAIKYSPKSDKVIVRASQSDNHIVVNVEDFGIGISKKDQEKIFMKFFRAENNIRQSFSGLGLGLYIASEIIRQHKGRIWINSIKGKGTTMSFKIPISNKGDAYE